MGRKVIKEFLDLQVLQDRRGIRVQLEALAPRGRKENEGILERLVMGRKGRKGNMALEDLKETEV